MKNPFYLIILFTILSLLSCDFDHKKIVYEQPDGFYRERYYINKVDSLKDGLYLKYFPNGTLWDSCTYKMGKLDGERKVFSTEGFMEVVENYKDGVFDGDYKVFYPNGQLKLLQNIKDGMIQGFSYSYYQSGDIKEKVTMKDNEENGPFEEYYENGTIHWKGQYLGGDYEQDSLYEYNDKGELIKKMFCNAGVCETIWKSENY
ncbi:MAG: hypothetical protein R2771_00200 [Saprospiraceae bacterium]